MLARWLDSLSTSKTTSRRLGQRSTRNARERVIPVLIEAVQFHILALGWCHGLSSLRFLVGPKVLRPKPADKLFGYLRWRPIRLPPPLSILNRKVPISHESLPRLSGASNTPTTQTRPFSPVLIEHPPNPESDPKHQHDAEMM